MWTKWIVVGVGCYENCIVTMALAEILSIHDIVPIIIQML